MSTEGSIIWSVGELAAQCGVFLKSRFARVTIDGEISGLRTYSSGHLYFDLKDEQGQLSAVIWASVATRFNVTPRDGMAVRVVATPDVYAKNGRLQLQIHHLEERGEGALRRQLEELRKKLEREGLFRPERKRPLPTFPRCIGVVTSREGAVFHDIRVRLQERFPVVTVVLFPVRVQGATAAAEVEAALLTAGRYEPKLDVVIVARGGGSFEELLPFSDERVVRAIFACPVPVISAVGHETDRMLSDDVADMRAPTPTAAAEMATPHREELLGFVADRECRLRSWERWFAPLLEELAHLTTRLVGRGRLWMEEFRARLSAVEERVVRLEPRHLFLRHHRELEHSSERLQRALTQSISQRAVGLNHVARRVWQASPRRMIAEERPKLTELARRLGGAAARTGERSHATVTALAIRLEGTNPQRVLDRGFAIVRRRGTVTSSVAEVQLRDPLEIQLRDGTLAVSVTEKER